MTLRWIAIVVWALAALSICMAIYSVNQNHQAIEKIKQSQEIVQRIESEIDKQVSESKDEDFLREQKGKMTRYFIRLGDGFLNFCDGQRKILAELKRFCPGEKDRINQLEMWIGLLQINAQGARAMAALEDFDAAEKFIKEASDLLEKMSLLNQEILKIINAERARLNGELKVI